MSGVNGAALGVAVAMGVVVVASRSIGRRTGVPVPVLLVVAGAAASFVPGVPTIRLQPSTVFFGFLPPLIYHAGVVTSPRELRANAAPIGLNALGLVLATTLAVAGAVWALAPGLGFLPAFVLGAVVAPTDPVASVSVLGRAQGPPRVTVILEGESLVNDGVALSLFSLGLAALASPVSWGGGLLAFARIAGGGVAFGALVGSAASLVRRPLRDPASRIVVSLLIPFAAYLPAQALGCSGVLSTLVTGLVLGERSTAGLGPSGRIRVVEFWRVLVFLLESALFLLLGLQLRSLVTGVSGQPPATVAAVAGAAVAVAVAVRLVWQLVLRTTRWSAGGALSRAERLAIGWSGVRGAISLAAALSIPVEVGGRPFPDRDLLIFATFCVIAVTLVGQATSLGWLLRRLGLAGSDAEARQYALAERRCVEAALRQLDAMAAHEEVTDEVADLLRQSYEQRLERVRAEMEDDAAPAGPSLRAVRRRLLAAQRDVLHRLHRHGEISYAVLRQVQRELDLEQAGLPER